MAMVAKTFGCLVEGCEGKHKSKGYCSKHYQRLKNFGDPIAPERRDMGLTPAEILMRGSKVQNNGCRLWTKSKNRDGYGSLGVDKKHYLAHRLAWELEHGEIPDDMYINHLCGNRACINVDHLELVTRSENNEYLTTLRSDNTSGYRNVYWHKLGKFWYVQVGNKGVYHNGGKFDTPEEANGVAIALRKDLGIREFSDWREENISA